jgi:hypothetical protein
MADNTGTGIDLSSIKILGDQAASSASQAATHISNLASQNTSTTDQLIAAIMGGMVGGDTDVSLRAKLLAEQEAQQNARKVYDAVGQGQGYAALVSNQISNYESTLQDSQELAGTIAKRESVGFFDNPLEYLWNQIMLPDERNALNAKLAEANVAKKRITDTNEMMSQERKIENEFKTTISAATIDSQTDALRQELAAKGYVAKLEANKTNAALTIQATNLQGQQLEIAQRFATIQSSVEHLAMAHEAAAQTRAKFEEWVKENKDKADFNEQITQWYNAGQAAVGKEPLTTDRVATMFKLYPEQSRAMIDAGVASISAGKAVLGASPWFAQNTMMAAKTAIPDSDAYVRDAFAAGNAAIQNAVKAGALKEGDKNQVPTTFNKGAVSYMTEMQKSVDYNNKNNPYILPSPVALTTGDSPSREILSSALWQKSLAARVEAGVLPDSDPKKIIDFAMEDYKAGRITLPEIAEGIKSYYGSGMVINNEFRKFERYGLPPQGQYVVKYPLPAILGQQITPGSFFSGYNNVDVNLTDPVQINKLLIKLTGSQIQVNQSATSMFGR